jgi:hypothetical protein
MKVNTLKLGNLELLLEKLESSNWSDPENYAKKRGLGKGWRFPSPEEFRYLTGIKKLEILPEGLLMTSKPYWTNFYLYQEDLGEIKYSRIREEIEKFIEEELEENPSIKIYDWTPIVKSCYMTIGGDVYELYNFGEYDEYDEKSHSISIYPSGGYLLVRDIK